MKGKGIEEEEVEVAVKSLRQKTEWKRVDI